MSTSPSDLKILGLSAAGAVMGEGLAEEVDVTEGTDSSDLPAYFFNFMFEQDRDRQRAALVRTRLAQKIRDMLIDRGDGHYPFVRVLRREDWGKRVRD
jgi:hypothetical protein